MNQPRYKVTTAPEVYPIRVDETLKRYCNLSTTDTSEDTFLTGLIQTATDQIERYIGYPLMTQVVEVETPNPIKRVQELTGNINDIIEYTYYDGTEDVNVTGASATGLEIRRLPILSYVGDENTAWPTGTRFRFSCNAGYTEGNCPDTIKQACRILIMSMYEDREGYKGMPETVTEILDFHVLYL